MARLDRAAASLGGGSVLLPAVEFRGITKSFPGQRAVDDVSFAVRSGEVHGLVGENGAGKTTLIKILAGNLQADAGHIELDGQPVEIRYADDATRLGVGFIHQEAALFTDLSVAENLAIGTYYQTSRFGLIDWKRQSEYVRPMLRRVGLDVDPRRRVETLSTHERQLVALARLLLQRCRVVVLDEATAPLADAEVVRLFSIVRALRTDGVAIVYVSHRLQEIFELADRVTVMRNGRRITTQPVAELSQESLTRLIIGSDPSARFQPPVLPATGVPVLRVNDLEDDLLAGISFELHRGEVLGLAGLAGSGRTNVVESIFGLRRPRGGALEFLGQPFGWGDPAKAVRSGIALVTESRQRDGMFAQFSVTHNITLPWLRKFRRLGLLRRGIESAAATAAAAEFDVRTSSLDTRMSALSGGNQQKAILARWLSQPIKLLLLDEPTHGVDIGAKAKIYEIIRRTAEHGVSVIVISSELEELEGLCSRVLLLAEGRIVGELSGNEVEKERILTDLYRAIAKVSHAA